MFSTMKYYLYLYFLIQIVKHCITKKKKTKLTKLVRIIIINTEKKNRFPL